MRISKIRLVFLVVVLSFCSTNRLTAQTSLSDQEMDEEVYYVGVNVLAPFTMIRSRFTGGYLPAATNLESAIAVFVGKIWNRNYNVETRVSYGLPKRDYTQFVVQSGGMYCFNSRKKALNIYTGIFLKIDAITDRHNHDDYLSGISYFVIGNRFKSGRFFLDLRLGENIVAVSWSNIPGHKTRLGFHEPIYCWKSAYVPFGVINLGFKL